MSECRFLRISRQRGETLTIGQRRVTPVALVVHVSAALGKRACAGAVWVRPLAVEVSEGGQTRRLPVVDTTLAAGLAFGMLSLALPMLSKAIEKKRR